MANDMFYQDNHSDSETDEAQMDSALSGGAAGQLDGLQKEKFSWKRGLRNLAIGYLMGRSNSRQQSSRLG